MERAQLGEITAFAAGVLTVDGGMITAVTDPGQRPIELIGALDYVKRQMLRRHEEGWDN